MNPLDYTILCHAWSNKRIRVSALGDDKDLLLISYLRKLTYLILGGVVTIKMLCIWLLDCGRH